MKIQDDRGNDNEGGDVDETLVLDGGIFTFIKDVRKVTFSEVTLHMELKIIVLSAQLNIRRNSRLLI
jgi:hypothetical protein